MSPATIGVVVFVCTFGGVLAGMRLGRALPEEHLKGESKESIRTGIGLIATMTALVLGLVTASAKQSFDEVDKTVRNVAADVLTLDGVLARYGPEAAPLRANLKAVVESRAQATWPQGSAGGAAVPKGAGHATAIVERFAAQVRALAPGTDEQAWLKSRATDLTESLMEVRFRVIGRIGSSVPVPYLVILVFWLTVTFASFGIFAPPNAAVVTVLILCSLSVAAAVFLVLELDGPFDGMVRVSPEPLTAVVSLLGR
jgi:hypothetical protein